MTPKLINPTEELNLMFSGFEYPSAFNPDHFDDFSDERKQDFIVDETWEEEE